MEIVANGMRALLVVVLGGSLVAAIAVPDQVFGPAEPPSAASEAPNEVPCFVGTDPSCVGPEATLDEAESSLPPPVVAVPDPPRGEHDDDGRDDHPKEGGKRHRDRDRDHD